MSQLLDGKPAGAGCVSFLCLYSVPHNGVAILIGCQLNKYLLLLIMPDAQWCRSAVLLVESMVFADKCYPFPAASELHFRNDSTALFTWEKIFPNYKVVLKCVPLTHF